MTDVRTIGKDALPALHRIRRECAEGGTELTPQEVVDGIVHMKDSFAAAIDAEPEEASQVFIQFVEYMSGMSYVSMQHATFDDRDEMEDYLKRALDNGDQYSVRQDGRLFHIELIHGNKH